MSIMNNSKKYIVENGFTIIDQVYTSDEVQQIIEEINQADTSKDTFRKSTDLFAIRQFLKEVPAVKSLILNDNLQNIIKQILGTEYFLIKSIYFDKPGNFNWYVAYHQDLTISVDKKVELLGFGPWTTKQEQFAVQPPIDFLENIFTIRIHLDKVDENNGAFKVIPRSHLKKIYRPETIDWNIEKETICNVPEGGVMIMKPLLLHSSRRTTNNKRRRVIHIEFASKELPNQINWSEKMMI